jgi:hypothetical protein
MSSTVSDGHRTRTPTKLQPSPLPRRPTGKRNRFGLPYFLPRPPVPHPSWSELFSAAGLMGGVVRLESWNRIGRTFTTQDYGG